MILVTIKPCVLYRAYSQLGAGVFREFWRHCKFQAWIRRKVLKWCYNTGDDCLCICTNVFYVIRLSGCQIGTASPCVFSYILQRDGQFATVFLQWNSQQCTALALPTQYYKCILSSCLNLDQKSFMFFTIDWLKFKYIPRCITHPHLLTWLYQLTSLWAMRN